MDSDDPPFDRRRGPSRLVQWTGAHTLHFWIVWPSIVLTLVVVAAVASYVIFRGPVEIRLALTRTNLIGLILALIVPPACVTIIWFHMRRRRHNS